MAFNKDIPTSGTSLRSSNPEILANQAQIQTALDNEHIFTGTAAGTQTGDHTQGSARCFSQAGEPATRIDGAGFLSTDLGSLWVDTDDNAVYVLTATVPTWTPVSDEVIATLLAQTNTWAEIQTFSETPVIPTGGPGFAPVGGTMEFAGASEPTGWKFCNGQLLDNSGGEFDSLWVAFGSSTTLYGGTGQTSFNVPDMRGRVPIGFGTGDATDATAHALGDKEGTEAITLTAAQSGLPAHTHTINSKDELSNTNGSNVTENATTNGTVSTQANSAAAAAEAHSNLQPSLTLNFIIKY